MIYVYSIWLRDTQCGMHYSYKFIIMALLASGKALKRESAWVRGPRWGALGGLLASCFFSTFLCGAPAIGHKSRPSGRHRPETAVWWTAGNENSPQAMCIEAGGWRSLCWALPLTVHRTVPLDQPSPAATRPATTKQQINSQRTGASPSSWPMQETNSYE